MHTAAQTTTGLLTVVSDGGINRQAVCKAGRLAPSSSTSLATPVLPQLPACRHFLNLTNGVEAVPLLESLSLPYRLHFQSASSWWET